MTQWLRLRTPNTGGLGLIPGQETRSHSQINKYLKGQTLFYTFFKKTRSSERESNCPVSQSQQIEASQLYLSCLLPGRDR